MDETAHSNNNATPTDEPFTPTDQDLINLFVKQQIETWGFDQVEEWFNKGFDLIVVKGRVLWVK